MIDYDTIGGFKMTTPTVVDTARFIVTSSDADPLYADLSPRRFMPLNIDVETRDPFNRQLASYIGAVHAAAGHKPKHRALWLHPTKGWRGAVYHPKRGRARPIPAMIQRTRCI